jgi:hypothetical protein
VKGPVSKLLSGTPDSDHDGVVAPATIGSRYEARTPGDGVEPRTQADGVTVRLGSMDR